MCVGRFFFLNILDGVEYLGSRMTQYAIVLSEITYWSLQ